MLIMFTTILVTGCNKTPKEISEEITINKTQKITLSKYENKQYRLKVDFSSNRTFKENVY